MPEERQDLKDRTRDFALRAIRLFSALPKGDAVAQVLGRQVLRSATSIGANFREAARGRSTAEFIAKIGDCLKEIDETQYWFELLVGSGRVTEKRMSALADEARQLNAILTAISKKLRPLK
ncbi:MAG: four helix bundle protein [Puniceicoccales bacterium]|jgi:four helix bundle protein|nr:four helix bundle protein [Puniceicoccales bacterium]